MKLNQRHELFAFMVACGRRDNEIAEELGFAPNYLPVLRKKYPEINLRIAEIQEEIKERAINKTVDGVTRWKERFNDGIEKAVNKLDDILESGNKEDGVQLKAALAWLDRAPDAPKVVTKEEIDRTSRLVFEFPVVEGIMQAARDIGVDAEFTEIINAQCVPEESDPGEEIVSKNAIKRLEHLIAEYDESDA